MRNGKFEMENGRKSFVLGIALLIAAVAFTLSACTVYDNYDIELMEAETADVSGDDPADLSSSSESKEVDEKSSSSKNGKDTSVIIIINQNSSSSEEAKSSSSEAEPVSSSQGDSFACGEATVTGKDLHEYKTVLIGKTCWTTENMRYKPKNGIARCYGEGATNPDLEPDAEKNCEEYGRLYDFETATGVCPTGWRLPTKDELQTLVGRLASLLYIELRSGYLIHLAQIQRHHQRHHNTLRINSGTYCGRSPLNSGIAALGGLVGNGFAG